MTKMESLRVLILVGGRSGEHEISLISGKHVLNALDKKKFTPIIVVIQKDGSMTLGRPEDLQKISNNPRQVVSPKGTLISIQPFRTTDRGPCLKAGDEFFEFDVAFPILHGPGGEDGTIQGLFELAEIPVVGCGVKTSAICMDKGITKSLCGLAKLPVVPFIEVHRGDNVPKLSWPYPVFVKPAHLGSSLGVTKVKKEADLRSACEAAFSLDEKILIEPAIEGREIEIALFGDRKNLVASPAGEIRPKAEFYSYEAKYVDADGAELILPAKISPSELSKVQEIAKSVFKTLECRGMARIDFFMTSKGEFFLNEVNTIPGFTPISMYPKLMQLAGLEYPELLEKLIFLAMQKLHSK